MIDSISRQAVLDILSSFEVMDGYEDQQRAIVMVERLPSTNEGRNNVSTKIRPELSKKSPYSIPKHRYYELVHFCLQYPDWVSEYKKSVSAIGKSVIVSAAQPGYISHDQTIDNAMKKAELFEYMKLVRKTATDTDSELGDYIFVAVTRGRSYEWFITHGGIPCGRSTFYTRRRKFFHLLSQRR